MEALARAGATTWVHMVIGVVGRITSHLRDITNQSSDKGLPATTRGCEPAALRKADDFSSSYRSDSVVDILPRLGSDVDGRQELPARGVPRVDSWNLPSAAHGMRVTFQVTPGDTWNPRNAS